MNHEDGGVVAFSIGSLVSNRLTSPMAAPRCKHLYCCSDDFGQSGSALRNNDLMAKTDVKNAVAPQNKQIVYLLKL